MKNKSGGCLKIRARAADGYSGLGKQNVSMVTENDRKFIRLNAPFTNKAVHKHDEVVHVHERYLSEISRNLAKFEKNCSAKNLQSYLIMKIKSH